MLITLERLSHSDINLLRELRNASREAFFDPHIISPDDQEQWWRRYSANPSIMFYTIWLNRVTPVGFLSVHHKSSVRYFQHGITKWFDICEVGNLLLAPAHRGCGIMHQALVEARCLHNPLTFWIAHVKPSNTVSLNLFARQGFVHIKPTRPLRQKKAAILETTQ